MSNFTTLFQFGCEFFGYENYEKMSKDYIKMYYNDWKNNYCNISVKQYKSLLTGRG